MNTQNWFPLGWTGWISLQSKGFSRVFNTTVQKHPFFCAQLSSQSNYIFCIQKKKKKKKLMSIKLVHIKRVYELLSSQPRDQAHITSISCTGRQITYRLWHLGIDMHFKNHCHQLLLFMTKIGEITLEEVLISILFSQGTVILGTLVITGTSQFLQWLWV